MRLSVIIVNYNAAPLLEQCLKSLIEHLRGITHEVLVVDNGSSDGSQTLITKRFPSIKLIENNKNLGFTAAVNIGIKRSQGQYVLWLNPDTQFMDNGIQVLLSYLDDHPQVGILGPQIMDPDGRRQLSARSFPSFRTALFHRYALLTRWFPSNPYSRQYLHSDWDPAKINDADWVSGACLLHRRKLSDGLKGLDERFFIYFEDVDFCYRAKQAGWGVQYHPGMRLLHHVAAGGSKDSSVELRMVFERHRSMWLYYAKHFRRNPCKDLLVAAAIGARGFVATVRAKIKV